MDIGKPGALTWPGIPLLNLPEGACDAHMHVFGSADKYPAAAGARYTLPNADVNGYELLARSLGIDRMVIVQPSFYATDNAYLLDALVHFGARARGIVMLPENVDTGTLDFMAKAGVRGLRLDLFKMLKEHFSMSAIEAKVAKSCDLAAARGWSVDIYAPGTIVLKLAAHFVRMPSPVSIAHMGFLSPEDGLTDAQADHFVDIVSDGNVWVKLTGAYRFGVGSGSCAGAARADRLAHRLIKMMPQNLLWGSDWPHVMSDPVVTSSQVSQLFRWCPEESIKHQILVSNPGRLYGFDDEYS